VNVEFDPAKPTNRSLLMPPGKERDLAIHTGLSVISERSVRRTPRSGVLTDGVAVLLFFG
jgi:hypothetical protein